MNKLPQVRHENIVVKDLENEVLIYDLDKHKAYTLNETSAIVWNLCDGKTSVAQMAKQLSEKLKTPVGEEVVWLALDSFKKDNLLADSENIEIEYNGLSRRQVIRQVGLASMIALPVVSSLIAPSAAHATSGAGTQANGTTCTNPGGGASCASSICTPTVTQAPGGTASGTYCCYAPQAPTGQVLVRPNGTLAATSVPACASVAPRCCSNKSNFMGGTCSCIN